MPLISCQRAGGSSVSAEQTGSPRHPTSHSKEPPKDTLFQGTETTGQHVRRAGMWSFWGPWGKVQYHKQHGGGIAAFWQSKDILCSALNNTVMQPKPAQMPGKCLQQPHYRPHWANLSFKGSLPWSFLLSRLRPIVLAFWSQGQVETQEGRRTRNTQHSSSFWWTSAFAGVYEQVE